VHLPNVHVVPFLLYALFCLMVFGDNLRICYVHIHDMFYSCSFYLFLGSLNVFYLLDLLLEEDFFAG
jgi:hypothetical protein